MDNCSKTRRPALTPALYRLRLGGRLCLSNPSSYTACIISKCSRAGKQRINTPILGLVIPILVTVACPCAAATQARLPLLCAFAAVADPEP